MPQPVPTVPGAGVLYPNLSGQVGKALRYRPEGGWFVIVDGEETFNRPLYGRGSGFRVDTGDRPEFLLYLPGRGGNLRLGLLTSGGAFWFHQSRVKALYRPGQMRHEITDPLMGAGTVAIDAVVLGVTDGLALRIEAQGLPAGSRLIWAFGGLDGARGRRDGDLGTEGVPLAEYFRLRPETCLSTTITFGDGFTLTGPGGTIDGVAPETTTYHIADASHWDNPEALLSSIGPTDSPVLIGQSPLEDRPVFLGFQRTTPQGWVLVDELGDYRQVTADRQGRPRGPVRVDLAPPFPALEWPALFDQAVEAHRAATTRVVIHTPDPFLDLAVTALQGAVEGVWDEQRGLVLHGAVAWRAALLGWRGAYALDALGFHDRARRHLDHWAQRQNTDPIAEGPIHAEEGSALARCEAGLHTNGDLSHSHYDMNLVWADTLVRHLRWTGDLDEARRFWPVFERHLAWERRLFRREFAPNQPLYEAYAAIWASDHIHYGGGGTALASAMNLFHHREAARWATALGDAPSPFDAEADAIAAGLRTHLWNQETGTFAEYRDWLGHRLLHPSAGLWTYYHLMDSEVPTKPEAQRMTTELNRRFSKIPVEGPGVPPGDWVVLPTSDWMPYAWSVNNVCLNENAHVALGLWQAGARDRAYRLLGGAVLAGMYQGICPGNVGSMNHLDVYRRESQRDFADGAGVLARAVVEGLFGVNPDLLAGELVLRPGFPAPWDKASMNHPDLDVFWSRNDAGEQLTVRSRFGRPLTLRIEGYGPSVIRSMDQEVTVDLPLRLGEHPEEGAILPSPVPEGWSDPMTWKPGRADPVDLGPLLRHSIADLFQQEYRSPRSPFVSLSLPVQGIGGWAGEVHHRVDIDDRGLRSRVREGLVHFSDDLVFRMPATGPNAAFTSLWDNFPDHVTVALSGRARGLRLVMVGTTNPMQSRLDNGEVVVTYADGGRSRLALRNPETWWPVDQDYFIDDYQFPLDGPLPHRLDLATGQLRILDRASFAGRGGPIVGGAATVLGLDLQDRELTSLTVRTLANDVVIGLLAATLIRDPSHRDTRP